MSRITQKLGVDFPGHSFEERKGMFGMEILVDGKVVSASWQYKAESEKPEWIEKTKGLSIDETMYLFFKEQVEKFLSKSS